MPVLVKIATELNVGTHTIVEFLTEKGFAIENKPNAKVSEEMYALLKAEFKGSADIKEKADQLQIGLSYKKQQEEKHSTSLPNLSSFFTKKTEPIVEEIKTEPELPTTSKIEELKTEIESIKEDLNTEENKLKVGLKVVGKIDLDAKKSKKKIEEPTNTPADNIEDVVSEEVIETPEEAKEEAVVETIDVPAEINPLVGESDTQEKTAEPEEYRATTPQLAGLKIKGKIDASKLMGSSKPTKKEATKETEKQPKAGIKISATSNESTADNDKGTTEKKRRKRKRKKITADSLSQIGKGRARTDMDKDQNKEISKKEIDEKIKATLARLGTGNKNKRQKIRRDSREIKRERQELQTSSGAENKLKLTEFISVSELANLMGVDATNVITTCMNLGVFVSINQRLDAEVIELVAGEFGYEVEFTNTEDELGVEVEIEDNEADLVPRAPIVTVMGHVDHGKTSLLDFIRKSNVAGGEAGGITQHIGAYEVNYQGRSITFLDTPGHEAFTAMRARGAKVTDIVVVIIAADDRVMPQTKEAISHAQAAGVPIIFAINKIDKEGADPDRIKQELASMNLLVEEWGGPYQSQDISAKNGLNIDLLLEKILLQADLLELKANPKRPAVGTVIEASLDKGKGYICKLLVQKGTLRIGDPMVSGPYSGKVKAMFNEKGQRIKEAGPSVPVMMLGLNGAPQAGEKFRIVASDQEARQIAMKRAQIEREQSNRASKRISLEEIGRRLALGNFKELNLIVKGDVDGSVEALSDSLLKLSIESIQVNVIHKGVGAIAESDILLASASDAIVIGFQVRPSAGAKALAEKEGVEIKTYSIIYEAIEHVKAAMEGLLDTIKEEKVVGVAQVREIFKISKIGTIAGCYVQEGKITRNSGIRVIRDGIVIYPNKEGALAEITSLKRFKEDVKEVKSGMECGLTIKNFNDIIENDVIEAYEVIETKQTLD